MGEQNIRKVQLVIVGSGPAGLTAAIYAARAGLAPVVAAGAVQGSAIPGGQLMITTEVENYPGFPEGISGPELMHRFFEQAKKFGAEVIEEWATDFQFVSGGPHKLNIGGQPFEAEAVILSNGASARWMGLPNEEKFINHGISACATCDGPLPIFRNKEIYVVGGGDSACEEAMFLTRFASTVFLVHRRDHLRASKIMAKRTIEHPKIKVLWNSKIVEYKGDEKLEGLVLENVVDGTRTEVSCTGLFMAIGHEPNTASLKKSAIELDDQNYVKVHNHVYTNIDGVFASGDNHDTVFRQAVTASGFGCMSAIACERWLESKHATSE